MNTTTVAVAILVGAFAIISVFVLAMGATPLVAMAFGAVTVAAMILVSSVAGGLFWIAKEWF